MIPTRLLYTKVVCYDLLSIMCNETTGKRISSIDIEDILLEDDLMRTKVRHKVYKIHKPRIEFSTKNCKVKLQKANSGSRKLKFEYKHLK